MASRKENQTNSAAGGRKTKSASGTGKKKTSGASAGGRKKNTGSVSRIEKTVPDLRERKKSDPKITQEAVVWLVLALCIFAFISYFGIGGYIGSVISDVSFGLFGVMAYLLPVLIFLAAAFLISNRGNRLAGFQVVSGTGLYLCFCCLTELLVNGYQPQIRIDKLYADSAALKTGGGAVGGAICSLLCPALGTAGAGVMTAVLALICLVILTQRSLFAGMRHQGERAYQSAQASKARRELRHQERLKRKEEARRERAESEKYTGSSLSSEEKALCDMEVALPRYAREADADRSSGKKKREKTETAAQVRGEKTADRLLEAETPQSPEIPVIFPSRPRERRMEHRVTGMTPDTWLRGDAQPESNLSGDGKSGTGRRKRRARVAAFPGQEETALETAAELPEEETLPGAQTDLFPEEELPASAVQISGLEEETDHSVQELPEDPSKDREAVSGNEAAFSERLFQSQSTDTEEEAGAGIRAAGRRAAKIAEDEPEEPAKSDWADSIWADEADLSRGGTSGTVFREAGHGKVSSGVTAASAQKREAEDEADGEMPESGAGKQGPPAAPAKKNPRSSRQEIQEGIASVEAEMAKTAETVKKEYVFPPLDLLKRGKNKNGSGQEQEIRKTAAKLQQTLDSFGVRVTVTNASRGPAVTRYELQPEQGVKVSRIVSLADDIKLNLAAADIRIEAPIPGKAAVGIEVPNAENSAVMLRDLLESEEFRKHPSSLAFATGKDIAGKVVVSDIAKMPHLLIAGATGSGKSVCINTLIMSILYKSRPEDVKLIMIDPKVVELSVYNGIPHLYIPVVTDPKKAAGALNWGVAEMTDRYNKFAEVGVRNLKGYNERVEALGDAAGEDAPKKLPQIVIIVDELADLMMVAPGEVEDSICRLAQLARAAGIHLIIATQRPSVNVITGLIKANMPSRIAFSVSSSVDSRTIIDMGGAEKLLGKGDMLFYPQGYQKPARVQGAFVSDEEVADVVDFLKEQNTSGSYNAEMEQQMERVEQAVSSARGSEEVDELFAEAGKFIIEKDKASIGMLQRVFKIGFNRAARIMDQLSEAGVVGPEEGTKPRKILMTMEEFENRT